MDGTLIELSILETGEAAAHRLEANIPIFHSPAAMPYVSRVYVPRLRLRRLIGHRPGRKLQKKRLTSRK